jgi:hypothetical protein
VTWQQFVVEHGQYASEQHLALVLGVAQLEIRRVRQTGACRARPRRTALGFDELFSLWHCRSATEADWPAPRRTSRRGGAYEWLAPELELLARLVGVLSVAEIAALLTTRLRELTGDPLAARTKNTVQIRINLLGLQSGTDLVGGLTTRAAAARVGRVSLINQAIHNKDLRTIRVGKRHVIPRDEFERWLSTREEPPAGWVPLASLRQPLGISSDSKLPEYAALGYIPDARRVKGIGTARGVWFIPPAVADSILTDAKAGRPMPWHGKPLPCNQRAMWRKWHQRKHVRCRTCRAIWGCAAPRTFDAFCQRYASLTIGQKRHLTIDRTRPRSTTRSRPRGTVSARMRDAGVTIPEAAAQLQRRTRWIRQQIRVGVLRWGGVVRDALGGEAIRITPLGLCILREVMAAEEASADNREWMGVHAAAHLVNVCLTTVHRWRQLGFVVTKRGPRGLLFERRSLETQAAAYWHWARQRYKRAQPPAWLQETAA